MTELIAVQTALGPHRGGPLRAGQGGFEQIDAILHVAVVAEADRDFQALGAGHVDVDAARRLAMPQVIDAGHGAAIDTDLDLGIRPATARIIYSDRRNKPRKLALEAPLQPRGRMQSEAAFVRAAIAA